MAARRRRPRRATGHRPARLNSLPHSIELSLQSRRLGADGHRLFRLLGQLPAGLAPEDRAALLGDSAATASEELRAVGLAFARGNRLDLLPPIRDHAQRFHPQENDDARRWREHYLTLLRVRGAKIAMAEGIGAVARLSPEFPNLEAALQAELAAEMPVDTGGTLTGLTRLMSYTGLGSPSIIKRLAGACQRAADPGGEANCICSLGDIALQRSDHDAASQAYESALHLYRQIGGLRGEANCIARLGEIRRERSDLDAARQAYESALPLR